KPQVPVDTTRRQIQVLVPHSAWDPGRATVRLAAGVGLWVPRRHAYRIPGSSATTMQPGGAGGLSNPTAFFNVAFRGAEPFQHPYPPGSVFSNPAWWRDRQQGSQLADGNLTPFHADVSFAKLEDGVTDDSGVPTTGP